MVKNIINNWVFRLFTPLFYGVTIYILILLIFDSIQKLSENFFSIEVFLSVFLTFILFETMRLVILLTNKFCPFSFSMPLRIFIQLGACMAFAVLITSIVISFYFSKIIGFNSYSTELVVFNTIFIVSSILYNMVYFSYFYLNRINTTELEKEEILRKNIEFELDTFKDRINQEFLYHSLETLIGLARKDTEEADGFILKLSDVYRNILSNKMTELSLFHEELKIAHVFIELLNYRLNRNLSLSCEGNLVNKSCKLVSGCLVIILEDIVNKTIISGTQPLEIKCRFENDLLSIYHPVQNKLIQVFSKRNELEKLSKACLLYGNNTISIKDEDGIRAYNIPVFEKGNKIN